MIRGFVTGLVWGSVVAGAGLAVMSQVVPLPDAPAPAEMGSDAASAAVSTPEGDVAPAPEAEPTPASANAGQGGQDEGAGALSAVKAPDAEAAPAAVVPEEPPKAPVTDAPDTLASPKTADQGADIALAAPEGGQRDLPRVAPLDPVPPLMAETAPAAAEPPPEPEPDTLLAKAPDAVVPPEPAPQPKPDAPAVLPEAPAVDAPRVIVPDGKPLTETAPEAESLPRIGDAPPAPEVAVPSVATPLDLFSRAFDNPSAKPLFAVLLIDDGAADTDRETLAALPFPITFVVDPLSPGAADAVAIYRKAGQEVVMQTSAVPKGATAADLEQSYQAFDLALPEAVAMLGVAGIGDNSQQTAAAAVPIIAAQGRGLVTMERGLNAADQVARRSGVPNATVFRILDASGESVPVIRRYLDRAAFRAAQEGSVVVLGSTRPDTIAALLQWTVEGRAASVAMAPISAVLKLEK